MGDNIQFKLAGYKRKYYFNIVLKGAIYTGAVLLSAFLFFNLIEYQFHSNSTFRAILFFTYLLICLFVLNKWIVIPLIRLFIKDRQISDDEAARQIGGFFPDIKDKLINLIQLQRLHLSNNALITASVSQKSGQITGIPFEDAISFKENIRYVKYLLFPFLVVLLIALIKPAIITQPTERIVHFNRKYIPQAPFQFVLHDHQLIAFKNEDYNLNLAIEGNTIPENVYLISNGRRIKLQKGDNQHFSHTFEKIQQNAEFHFEAAGFSSAEYKISVVSRPNIRNFDVQLNYPKYLDKKIDHLNNIGNFQIPEGTLVKWTFNTINANEVEIKFGENDRRESLKSAGDEYYELEKQVFKSTDYQIFLQNQYSNNKDQIKYNIDVIPDQFPKINLDQFQDTVLYDLLILGGNISDDYGLSDLKLFYKVVHENRNQPVDYQNVDINIDPSKSSQSFYYQWRLEPFHLSNGEKIEYYLQVRDNDGIHGKKATKTGTYTFELPTREEVKEDLKISTESTENQIDNSLQQAKQLSEKLDNLEDKFKGKKDISWQDQKQLEELMKQKEALQKSIKELQEQFKNENMKRERFSQEKNERIKEKVEQLQKLMDELLDEKTKKLYDELQRLLDENKDINQIKDLLHEMNQKSDNMEKELDRTLELFKKMKFEYKLEQNINDLQNLQKEQEKLSDDAENKKEDQQQLMEQQEKLNNDFNELQQDMRDMEKLNQEMRNPQPMENTSEEEKNISDQQKDAQQNLEQNKLKKASQSQKGASQSMKQLQQKLQNMQTSMMSSALNMNIAQLRDILDNLIRLSFNQETIMDEFRKVNQSDPRFLELSEKQLDLRDDAKVIQDSLLSLSKQAFSIQSFVTREVGEMNRYLDETADAIKERKKGEAVGYQQLAMTSVNNLALMLDDVLTQMMNAANGSGGQSGNQPIPNLSQLQQQLNQKINQLKKSGLQGRQLSEELAKMAAEQERIRQMLQKLDDKMRQNSDGKEGAGDDLKDVQDKMEQSELDLVNKQLTDRLIQRQKEIMTRLLESEKSMRERDLDKEREGEHAKDYERKIPKAFDQYIKMKEQEIELIKTVPPKLNPYYKKEVNEYFKRIGSF